MRSIIRASTTSMTSVPKPLKFMRPHYATIKEIHKKMAEGPTKVGSCCCTVQFIKHTVITE